VLAILSPIIAKLIQLAVSRRREFLADASGALLCRNPDALARALEKISSDTDPLETANKATDTVHQQPARHLRFNNLFTHRPRGGPAAASIEPERMAEDIPGSSVTRGASPPTG
jgi:heat shock protein HtpX